MNIWQVKISEIFCGPGVKESGVDWHSCQQSSIDDAQRKQLEALWVVKGTSQPHRVYCFHVTVTLICWWTCFSSERLLWCVKMDQDAGTPCWDTWRSATGVWVKPRVPPRTTRPVLIPEIRYCEAAGFPWGKHGIYISRCFHFTILSPASPRAFYLSQAFSFESELSVREVNERGIWILGGIGVEDQGDRLWHPSVGQFPEPRMMLWPW